VERMTKKLLHIIVEPVSGEDSFIGWIVEFPYIRAEGSTTEIVEENLLKHLKSLMLDTI
jgi:hypothetical protein